MDRTESLKSSCYTIPFGHDFLDGLAKGVLDLSKQHPLHQIQVFLPTARAIQTFHHKLLSLSQAQGLILPRCHNLGAVIDDDQIISNWQRHYLWVQFLKNDCALSEKEALSYIPALAQMMDQFWIDQFDLKKLDRFIPDHLAQHWQKSVEILKKFLGWWPEELKRLGLFDRTQSQNLYLEKIAQSLSKSPPTAPVILAGSTASHTATLKLLKSIYKLPLGMIVFHGLDPQVRLSSKAFNHPSFGMVEALGYIGLLPDQIQEWPYLNTIEKPERPDFWQFSDKEVEAQNIARYLAAENKKIALITPDAELLQRCGEILESLGKVFDNGQSRSLNDDPLGLFFMEIIHVCQHGRLIDFYVLLDHPLVTNSYAQKWFLEIDSLLRQGSSLSLQEFLLQKNIQLNAVGSWQDWLKKSMSLLTLLRQNSDDEKTLLSFVLRHSQAFLPQSQKISFEVFQKTIEQIFLDQKIIDPKPVANIFLLQPLDARFHIFDEVILAGLNEGIWPYESENIWLSKSMCDAIGFYLPRKRLGLQVHDFEEFHHSTKLTLSRHEQSAGKRSLPSRFWMAAKARSGESMDTTTWHDFGLIGEGTGVQNPLVQWPKPYPKMTFSASKFSAFHWNPYAIYAKYILALQPKDPLIVEFESRDRGNILHQIIYEFHEKNIRSISEANQLIDRLCIDPLWGAFLKRDVALLWDGLLAHDQELAPILKAALNEISFKIDFNYFDLQARADRLEEHTDGSLRIIDFKSGNPPSNKDLDENYAMQLPLEALLLSKAALNQTPYQKMNLDVWKVSGKLEKKTIANPEKTTILIGQSQEIIDQIIQSYFINSNEIMPYPQGYVTYQLNEYDDLARIEPWQRQSN